jgi:hypothetical protein
MPRSFSYSEYIDIVQCVVKSAGVLLEPKEFPCDFLFWGYMKDLVYSISIDTIEVLRERVENGNVLISETRCGGTYSSLVSVEHLRCDPTVSAGDS